MVARAQVQLGANVVRQVTRSARRWVRAVAAKQSLDYANGPPRPFPALRAIERMQQVGNFIAAVTRQQSFYADSAQPNWRPARHASTAKGRIDPTAGAGQAYRRGN
jgi:hypothetical protein